MKKIRNTNNNDIAAEKKKMIIRASIKVIAKNGYQRSRISDIVEEAGIAHGLFYHYFPSKEDLMIGIFTNSWEIMINYIKKINSSTDDVYERIEKIILFIVRSFEVDPDVMKVLIMDIPRLEKFYSDSAQKLYHKFFDEVAFVINEGQKKGLVRKDIDGEVLAFMLHGSVDSVIRQYVYNPKYYNKKISVEKMKKQISQVLIDGIRKR